MDKRKLVWSKRGAVLIECTDGMVKLFLSLAANDNEYCEVPILSCRLNQMNFNEECPFEQNLKDCCKLFRFEKSVTKQLLEFAREVKNEIR